MNRTRYLLLVKTSWCVQLRVKKYSTCPLNIPFHRPVAIEGGRQPVSGEKPLLL